MEVEECTWRPATEWGGYGSEALHLLHSDSESSQQGGTRTHCHPCLSYNQSGRLVEHQTHLQVDSEFRKVVKSVVGEDHNKPRPLESTL